MVIVVVYFMLSICTGTVGAIVPVELVLVSQAVLNVVVGCVCFIYCSC